MPSSFASLFGFFLVLAGCGGRLAPIPETDTASVTGTIGGHPVVVVDSFFEPSQNEGSSLVVVGLTNEPKICSLMQSNGNPKSSAVLVVGVLVQNGDPNGPAPVIAPGTYEVTGATSTLGQPLSPDGNASAAVVAYDVTDAQCEKAQTVANHGTVTITSLLPDELVGSFDVTFASGDHLTGTFDVPTCAGTIGANEGPEQSCK